MNISQIFNRRKQQVFDSQRSVRQQYLAAVRSLAAGSEVDEESIIQLIDELSISEAQLQADIERQTQRNVAAAELRQAQQATADVQRLTVEQDRLTRERDEFMAKWSPMMESIAMQLRSAQQSELLGIQAKRRLEETIIDVELLDRQKMLESRRRDVHRQLIELEEETESAQRFLNYARSVLESEESAIVVEGIHETTTKIRERNKALAIKEAQSKLESAQAEAATVFGQRDRLKDQLRQIDREQQELNKQKLIA
jgi:hypothetical protein